jgi:hypothetical protein
MDHYKQCMINKSTNKVGSHENSPPGLIGQEPGTRHLENYQERDKKKSGWVFPDQFTHVRVLLQNLPRPNTMWL